MIAAALEIASRQDTSTYTARDKSFGASISYQIGGSVSAQGNMAKGSQQGDFASVKEQAGIQAGAGGFDINVKGNTGLVTVWFRSLVSHYATLASKANGLMPPRNEWRLRAL